MRIIAGAWRGRRLASPQGEATRPTADRTRQAIFDILAHAPFAGRAALEQARVVDAFAGTGAMGLEALSRGAAHATFFETARPALAALRANIAACRAEERAAVVAADVLRPPRAQAPATLIFLDPPYARGLLPPSIEALAAAGWLASDALVVAELGAGEPLPVLPGLAVVDRRAWGAAQVLFLRPA